MQLDICIILYWWILQAASAYVNAKIIIKLINNVAKARLRKSHGNRIRSLVYIYIYTPSQDFSQPDYLLNAVMFLIPATPLQR